VNAVDIFGISDIVNDCDGSGSNWEVECASSVVDTLSTFDPTGLLTIAGAFLHPTCT